MCLLDVWISVECLNVFEFQVVEKKAIQVPHKKVEWYHFCGGHIEQGIIGIRWVFSETVWEEVLPKISAISMIHLCSGPECASIVEQSGCLDHHQCYDLFQRDNVPFVKTKMDTSPVKTPIMLPSNTFKLSACLCRHLSVGNQASKYDPVGSLSSPNFAHAALVMVVKRGTFRNDVRGVTICDL